MVEINYKGSTISSIEANKTAILRCAEKITNTDIVIKATDAKASVSYDGNVIASLADGQTATLKCANKLMKSDISIVTESVIVISTMTIGGTTYEFESGMTWSEWVASSYNTDGYKVVDGVVTTADGTKEVYESVIGTIYSDYGIEDNGLIYTLKAAKFNFTIDGKSYTATYGMSWGEWCESAYNTDSYFVTDEYELEYIENAEGTHRVEDPYAGAVTADDVVVGEDYILVEKMQTLSAPSIEIDGTTLNIYDEEGLATEYDILVDGVVKETVSAVSLITFTYGSTSYQAESGMTWVEWVASDYNTDGFTISGSYVYSSTGAKVDDVTSTDTIVDGGAYTGSSAGGAY